MPREIIVRDGGDIYPISLENLVLAMLKALPPPIIAGIVRETMAREDAQRKRLEQAGEDDDGQVPFEIVISRVAPASG
jgi:hypothetical protein